MNIYACLTLVLCLSAGSSTMVQAQANSEAARKAEQQSCLPCHSLRLIDSQRLSAAAWQKEMDKMIGWGAIVPDRQLLIDYLSQNYSNAVAPPTPVVSANGK